MLPVHVYVVQWSDMGEVLGVFHKLSDAMVFCERRVGAKLVWKEHHGHGSSWSSESWVSRPSWSSESWVPEPIYYIVEVEMI
jgi:hypothetical protein